MIFALSHAFAQSATLQIDGQNTTHQVDQITVSMLHDRDPEFGPITLHRPADLLSPWVMKQVMRLERQFNTLWTVTYTERDPADIDSSRVSHTLELGVVVPQGWKLELSTVGFRETITLHYSQIRRCDHVYPGPVITCSSWDTESNRENW